MRNHPGLEWLKALVCLGATVWLLVDRRQTLVSAETWTRMRRPGMVLLLVAALAALVGWGVYANNDFRRGIHLWDTYHYYMGAKYFPELGYRGLYNCTLAADLEAGEEGELARRPIRDLDSNRLLPATLILERARICRRHFEPDRWRSFAGDVAWFRGLLPRARWHDLQRDHGFNGTPVWLIMGRLFTAAGPASQVQIFVLAALDFALLGLMWLLVLRAFGGRATLTALAFWAGNYPARFTWTATAFLRQPWLVTSVGGICLLRQGSHLVAGVSLGAAALLRIFPGALLFGPLLNIVRSLASKSRPRLADAQRRFLLGLVLSGVVLLPISFLAGEGPGVWVRWGRNMATHLSTPSTNLMGLKVVAAYDHGVRMAATNRHGQADPYRGWREGRQVVFEARRPGFILLVGIYLLLLARGVWGREAWQAALLSIGLIPVATASSCYYMAILLGYGLLVGQWRGVGVGLNLHAALGWAAVLIWPFNDELYTWLSVLSVVYVVAVTARAAVKE